MPAPDHNTIRSISDNISEIIKNIEKNDGRAEMQEPLRNFYVKQFEQTFMQKFSEKPDLLKTYAEHIFDQLCKYPGATVPNEYFDKRNLALFIKLEGNIDQFSEQMFVEVKSLDEVEQSQPIEYETGSTDNESVSSENSSHSPEENSSRKILKGKFVQEKVNNIENNIEKQRNAKATMAEIKETFIPQPSKPPSATNS